MRVFGGIVVTIFAAYVGIDVRVTHGSGVASRLFTGHSARSQRLTEYAVTLLLSSA
jgi:hypothetical protein